MTAATRSGHSDVVDRVVCRRPWWRRFPIRAEVLPAYVIAIAAIVLGLSAQQRLITTNRANIERLCTATRADRQGLRALVIELTDSSPDVDVERRRVLLEILDRNVPDERVCR